VANKFTGTVVYITSPTQFWLLNSVDDDTVMGIGAELAEHCNSSSMQRLRSPSVGQLCAALYDEDNTWYRGVVTKLLDGNNVQVCTFVCKHVFIYFYITYASSTDLSHCELE